MGVNVSNQMIDSTTSIVSNALNEVSTELNSSVSSYTASTQQMPIRIKTTKMVNSNLNFSQNADLKITTMLQNSNELSNDLTNKLEAKLKETLTNQLTQANEDLNLGQLNISNAQTSTKTYIEQNLSTVIKTGVNNSVSQYANGIQYMPVEIKDVLMENSSMNFSQSMLIKVLAKNISTNIVDNVIKSTLTADVQKKIQNKAEQLNKGIDLMGIFSVIAVVGGGVFLATASQIIDFCKENPDHENCKVSTYEQLGGYDQHYGGLTKEEKEETLYKKKLFLGCIVLLILIYLAYKYAKKWVADRYDISYLGHLKPETKSGFYVRPNIFYKQHII
jgi:hypothetical protein